MQTSQITNPSVSLNTTDPQEQEGISSSAQAHQKNSVPFAYSKESPVKELTDEEQIKAVVTQFNESVEQYATDKDGKSISAPPSQYKMKNDPRKLSPAYQQQRKDDKAAAAKWNQRSSDSRVIATDVQRSSVRDQQRYNPDNPTETRTFSYDLGGHRSAAVMSLQHDGNSTQLKSLASHPSTSGAGETMIEKAVNESQARGQNGQIYLMSLNSASDGFYKNLGFTDDQGELKLNPSESELWSQKDGTWSLNKNEGTGYLTERTPATQEAARNIHEGR